MVVGTSKGGLVSRRNFLRAGVACGAAVGFGGGLIPWVRAGGAEGNPASLIRTIQAYMTAGKLTSRDLTQAYLQRISLLNPLLAAVIETNPDAIAIAIQLDDERRVGQIRGALHGIPILVKDNIATFDGMQTTAGSLALVGSRVPADAQLVARLRSAGAVILGKANMSEWANFRGYASIGGWSARKGFTRNPYNLALNPLGSSSGPAVAIAASLCAGSVGTETNGSILAPAGNNLVVGLKPTVGLISQQGVVPVARSQDTPGPLGKTVTDVAILLGVLQSPFGDVAGRVLPSDYTSFLQRGTLSGARIGLDRRYFYQNYGGKPDIIAGLRRAIDTIQTLGATLVIVDSGDMFTYVESQSTVLLQEFKIQIGDYLSQLSTSSVRNLSDLITFNRSHCREELKYFGQENFELSVTTNGSLLDSRYLQARASCLRLSRAEGIDGAMQRDNLDAIIAPSNSYAAGVAAVAGYPSLSLPVGITADGKPVGLWMYGGFLSEPKLLALAYDLEQELGALAGPQYLNSVPADPPDVGNCAA